VSYHDSYEENDGLVLIEVVDEHSPIKFWVFILDSDESEAFDPMEFQLWEN